MVKIRLFFFLEEGWLTFRRTSFITSLSSFFSSIRCSLPLSPLGNSLSSLSRFFIYVTFTSFWHWSYKSKMWLHLKDWSLWLVLTKSGLTCEGSIIPSCIRILSKWASRQLRLILQFQTIVLNQCDYRPKTKLRILKLHAWFMV